MEILYMKTDQLLQEFKRHPYSDEIILNITELFREMRNVCSMVYANPDYQCGIAYYADGGILRNVIDIISHTLPILLNPNPQSESLEKCFAIGMQLIGNLVVGNIKNQEIILVKYLPFLKNAFSYDGARNYIYMIYYNCYLGSPHLEQLIISHSEAMTELASLNLNSDFAEYFIELYLDRCQNFDHFFENVAAPERPALMNMIRQRYLTGREKSYSTSVVTFLQNRFKSYNQEALLQSFKSSEQTTAKEAAGVLDLLSNFSSNENYLKTYQQDSSLFQYTVDLLLTIHYVDVKTNSGFNDIFSKTGSNGFKLGPSSFFENVQKNPAYIFKVNLVRLISNLAWHNPNLDNKQVERKNLIPALLACCCVDAVNPFIFEWAVFAIHNLRENHINNQRHIEMLRRQGTISKPMMKQMNQNMSTSSYRFCVPGHKEPLESGLPIELLDMSRSERKRYLRNHFTSGDPELLSNLSDSSESSGGNDAMKKSALRRKCKKTKKEYHKYSSSSSSSSTFHSDSESDKQEEELEEKEPPKSPTPSTNKDAEKNHNCEYETEEECSNLVASMNINDSTHSTPNNDNENTYLYENFEKDKQQKRFTERF